MLDLKQIRETPDTIQALLNRRSASDQYDLTPILERDRTTRELESVRTELQARSNEIGKLIGQKIKSGVVPKGEEIKTLKEEGNTLKTKLGELEPQERQLKAEIEARELREKQMLEEQREKNRILIKQKEENIEE